MKNILLNCYYDGMTLQEAIEFSKNYNNGKEISKKSIEKVVNTIKKTTNKDWKQKKVG